MAGWGRKQPIAEGWIADLIQLGSVMALRSFFTYLRTLGWKVWTLSALTVLAIFVFCGWLLGVIILAVVCLAMIPAARVAMRVESEKGRQANRDEGPQ